MNHLIQKQYLHVELSGTESDGFLLSSRLPAFNYNWLLPSLEKVLDDLAPTKGHLYISKLEVDAGTIAFSRLETDLPKAIAIALEKAIREHTLNHTSSISPADKKNTPPQFKTNQQKTFDAFLYFLETGALPWSFRLPKNTTLEQWLLTGAPVEKEQPVSIAQAMSSLFSSAAGTATFLHLLSESEAARRRLRWQFSSSFVDGLISYFSPMVGNAVRSILPTLEKAAMEPDLKVLFQNGIWQTVFTTLQARTDKNIPGLISDTLHHLSGSLPEPSLTELIKETTRLWPELEDEIAFPKAPERKPEPPEKKGGGPVKKTPFNGKDKEIAVHTSAAIDAKEGVYVDNAGLVILHPFLPQFFVGLGLANEQRMVQPERALCLLHFLATGQTAVPEYSLPFPKLLCGLPLETPVQTNLTLTDEEKAEAIALLEAVIRHWQALRSTSPDGLRGTFLTRAGKLSATEDGSWLLQVEQQSFDLLLDDLPWSISLIKLPWMEQILKVEWA